jgi:hypothetical protein
VAWLNDCQRRVLRSGQQLEDDSYFSTGWPSRISARGVFRSGWTKKRKAALVVTIVLTLVELVALKYLNLFVIGARGFGKLFSSMWAGAV